MADFYSGIILRMIPPRNHNRDCCNALKIIVRKVFILLLSLSFLTSCAQKEDYSGTYYYESAGQKYHLSLNSDGSFLFSHYWKGSEKMSPSVVEPGSEHGKGIWTYEKGDILFFNEPELDIDQEHRLNFNNTVADLKDSVQLIFIRSEIFWLENIKMEKIK